MKVDRLGNARRPLMRVGLVALGFAVSFVLVYYVTVRTVPGRHVADASLRGALLAGSGPTAAVDAVLNVVSVTSLLGAIAAVAVIALLRLDRVHGLAAIGILLGSNVSTWLLKNVLLARPDVGVREVSPTHNSLPSGHTAAAFSVLAAFLFVGSPRWRLPVAILGGGYCTLTGLATMLAGWHRAGDSVASFAVVGVWTSAAAVAVIVSGTPAASSAPVRSIGSASVRWLAASAAGSLALGVLLAIALATAPTVLDTWLGAASAFVAGGLLITGSAIAAVLGVLAVLAMMDAAATDHSGGCGRRAA